MTHERVSERELKNFFLLIKGKFQIVTQTSSPPDNLPHLVSSIPYISIKIVARFTLAVKIYDIDPISSVPVQLW